MTLKKFIFAICLIFSLFFSFAENWYICLGSYKILNNAVEKKDFFERNDIPVLIKEFTKSDSSKLYRILFSESLETKENALLLRRTLLTSPLTKNVVSDDIWIFSVAQKILPGGNPEKRIINIKDSDTGNPIDNANVDIDEKWNVMTNERGDAPLPEGMPDGKHSIYITKGDDYVPTTGSFNLVGGEIVSAPQYSIPQKVDYDRVKIILTWGEYPSDLDSHIFSNSAHVYYNNETEENMNLDHDDTTSYGPETITIREPSENDRYCYYVFNYSDKDNSNSLRLSNSEAQISVYYNNEYIKSFTVKPNESGIWWHVFDLVDKNRIIVFDTISKTKD